MTFSEGYSADVLAPLAVKKGVMAKEIPNMACYPWPWRRNFTEKYDHGLEADFQSKDNFLAYPGAPIASIVTRRYLGSNG